MRVFITGGSGFVGQWLARDANRQGDSVIATDRDVDVTDLPTLTAAVTEAAPDVVYHLAAMTHVGASWESPIEVLRVNVLGTAGVLAAARRCRRQPRVIVVSSSEVYGAAAHDEPLEETTPVAPVTPYAASKAAAEQVALQAWRGYGQPVIVARPFTHVGPGQDPAFAVSGFARRIVEAQRSGAKSLAVGNLESRRDLTDVRDVVRAYRELALFGEPGQIYNICSGRDVALSEIVSRLLQLAGADLQLVIDPDLLRPVDVATLRGSARRLIEATGWRPLVPLEQTLRDVLDFWRRQPSGEPERQPR